MFSQTIVKILTEAVRAPSGDNCQPWRFEVSGSTLTIFNIPERDYSLYNFEERASLIAHGALIENIAIIARVYGYKTTITLLPKDKGSNATASITFEKTTPIPDPLYEATKKRYSDRHPYTDRELSKEMLSSLERVATPYDIRIVIKPELRKKLAGALAIGNRMLFENRRLHDFLFEHISWSKHEIEVRRAGFHINELHLYTLWEFAFSFLKPWWLVRIGNLFGLASIIDFISTLTYRRSAAFIAIPVENNSPEEYIAVGRVTERIWLEATRLGLRVQPGTGVLFPMLRIEAHATEDLSRRNIKWFKSAYKTITDSFGIHNKKIAMVLRVGFVHGGGPTSLRQPPHIDFR